MLKIQFLKIILKTVCVLQKPLRVEFRKVLKFEQKVLKNKFTKYS